MDFVEEIFIEKNKISERVKELGQEITRDYKNKNLLLISILKGSVIFFTDLIREINIYNCELDYMHVSSYIGTVRSDKINVIKDLNTSDITKFDVLIVEDIFETGHTLKFVKNMLSKRNPKSLKICCLLDKPEMHEVDIQADYVGFEIQNKFVIGYGMDYNEKYRNLPFIGVLNKKYIN